MNKTERIEQQRNRHNAALLALANSINPENTLTGLQLWRKLRRLEVKARNAATAQCNGEAYGGEPFREEADLESFQDNIRSKVAAIFGGVLPPGFRINNDPRGCALKLASSDSGNAPATPFELEQDWGRNQLLAPFIGE